MRFAPAPEFGFGCQIVMEVVAMVKDDSTVEEGELHAAIDILRRMMPEEDVKQLQPSHANTVYTTYLTLWMLILQRLGGGKSLEEVVQEVLSKIVICCLRTDAFKKEPCRSPPRLTAVPDSGSN